MVVTQKRKAGSGKRTNVRDVRNFCPELMFGDVLPFLKGT
jgi:hypothetical protein